MHRLFIFLCKHCSRTTYHLSFLKCESDGCDHCRQHPVRSVEAITFLWNVGGRLFSPTASVRHPGHYLTFQECCIEHQLGRTTALPDGEVPSGIKGRCPHGCQYVFTSQHDKDRHERIVHEAEVKACQRAQRAEKRKADGNNEPPAKNKSFVCTYPECTLAFTSGYQLNKHKKDAGHTLGRGRPNKGR